jgi:cell division protein FtsB
VRIDKRIIIRLFFAVEVVVFMGSYFFGVQGIQAMRALDLENKAIALEMATIKSEVDQLDQQIIAWSSNDFYKEKIAREQLQMAHAQDEVYFIIKS